ncbi:MAG: hypothetical protein IT310_09930 [Anaerolineales bacterium]|nr:hypothetical protein [Anaerolineales bacterium]
MNIQHINVKFYLQNPETVNLESYNKVFNSWIQNHRVAELLIDVADYLHVHHGPGMMLIGHEANYSLDNAEGRLGLLYNRKIQETGSNAEKLLQAFRAALTAAQILETENGLRFNAQEVQVILNDRLLAPNTAETFAALQPDFQTFFDKLYGGAAFTFERNLEARQRFTLDVETDSAPSIESLLTNLLAEAAVADA